MKINVIKPFPVSLDDGLTVTTIFPGEQSLDDWVARLAINHYGAKEVKKAPAKKAGK